MRTILYAILLLGLPFLKVRWEKNKADERPNILWISHEDFSPAWGCYGDAQATTPHIDSLAKDGYLFTQAFSNAPICAPARATLISGIYATSYGTQNLRSEIPVPENFEILPQYLQKAGYFTSNNSKTDYNFSPQNRWDDLGDKAHWRNRKGKAPFFAVFNSMITHEGHTNRYVEADTKALKQKHKPEDMVIPPYFPDNPGFRKIMAHQYDLMTVFDNEMGEIIRQLKADGEYDNTIIFVFSDHGHGLPRYKRWLYDTGLRIPFILHVPDKFKHLVSNIQPGKNDLNVSFVDFAPTVLKLAGIEVPKIMEGQNFLGPQNTADAYSFGYRDRADDVYDMSRSVFDGRYIYIRNFMPHQPYIIDAHIFGPEKWSYEVLLKAKENGELSAESLKMFAPKPVEELYDLQTDPMELSNIIADVSRKEIVKNLKALLKTHLLKCPDTGLMNEGQMMILAKENHTSVYDLARNPHYFNVTKALKAAEKVGVIQNEKGILKMLRDKDPNVRFWGLNALQSSTLRTETTTSRLEHMLSDESKPNACLAAEILIVSTPKTAKAYRFLRNELATQADEPMVLQLSIAIRNLGDKASPLVKDIREKAYPKIAGTVSGKYKSWSYPMFIGFAFDQVFENTGTEK